VCCHVFPSIYLPPFCRPCVRSFLLPVSGVPSQTMSGWGIADVFGPLSPVVPHVGPVLWSVVLLIESRCHFRVADAPGSRQPPFSEGEMSRSPQWHSEVLLCGSTPPLPCFPSDGSPLVCSGSPDFPSNPLRFPHPHATLYSSSFGCGASPAPLKTGFSPNQFLRWSP